SDHAAFIDVHEFAIFRREHERRWMSEIGETKMVAGLNFAVQHSRKFAGMFFLSNSERIAGSYRLRHAQIEVLEEIGCCFPVSVQFTEYQSVECGVNCRRGLC